MLRDGDLLTGLDASQQCRQAYPSFESSYRGRHGADATHESLMNQRSIIRTSISVTARIPG